MPDIYHVGFTRRAASDLEGIFRYISNRSPGNAPKVIKRLVDAIDSLAQLPHRYRKIERHPRSRPETGMMPVSPYLIYYRVLEPQQAVRVITVRHGAQRQPDQME